MDLMQMVACPSHRDTRQMARQKGQKSPNSATLRKPGYKEKGNLKTSRSNPALSDLVSHPFYRWMEGADGDDEFFSPILPIVEPAEGGDELCSVAPPEVSALPDGGTVADLDASGDVVFAVGGWVGGDEFSVAIAGANPMASAVTVIARRRVISCSFRCWQLWTTFRAWIAFVRL